MQTWSINELISDKISGEWGDEVNGTPGVKILRTTNFTNDGRLNFDNVVLRKIRPELVEKKRLVQGDIIIEKSGGSPNQPVGRVVFFDETDEFLCNNFTAVLRPAKKVYPKYLFYALFYMHQSKRTLRYQNKTTGILNLKLERYLDEERIPLPDYNKQKEIAHILSQADKARQQRKAANALTEQFLQSTFLSLFGDLVANDRRWPVHSLIEIAEVSSGITKGRKLAGQETILAPYMRVANVQDGMLDLSEIKEIELKKDELGKFLLKDGDILLTEGGDPDKLGRGAVWQNQIEGCVHQNHIFKVRADKMLFAPEFLSYQFGSAYGKRYFFRAAKQTTGIASINSTQLKAFPVLTPPLKLQQQFAAIVEQTEVLRQRQRAHAAELEGMFQGLLQKYFNS